MDLSIIIISFNTRELTLACLNSVFDETKEIDFEVIVVDNDSEDGSVAAIREKFQSVKVISLERNKGFAVANNIAAAESQGRYLLLLNSDTVVLDGAVDKLVGFAAKNQEWHIFGGRTLWGDRSLNPTSCRGRPTPWSAFCRASGLSAIFKASLLFDPESMGTWKRDNVREVDIVTGCFFLIEKELWQLLNGFDERFFMYGEETDLCLRARKRGKKCVLYPDATIIHYGGASERCPAEKRVRLFKALARVFRKNWTKRQAGFGVFTLDLWAFSRMVAFWVLKPLGDKWGVSYRSWRAVWRQKHKWGRGEDNS